MYIIHGKSLSSVFSVNVCGLKLTMFQVPLAPTVCLDSLVKIAASSKSKLQISTMDSRAILILPATLA